MTEAIGSDETLIVATRPQRFALHVLQLGAVAVVVVASTHTTFELDRFLIPKELVLHSSS